MGKSARVSGVKCSKMAKDVRSRGIHTVLSSKLIPGLAFRNLPVIFTELTFSASLPPSILYLGLKFKVFWIMSSWAVIASSIVMSE